MGLAAGKRRATPNRNQQSIDVARRPSAANFLICAFLIVASFAIYAQVFHFQFVNYDDPEYVSANPHVRQGITADGIVWAFTSTEAANWFPLTRLSEMLDWQLFGLRAGWHHLTNVAIHAAAAVLLFLFLLRATGARWPSAFVAFVFALHPLHVESVAWVAERKDVLNAFFWFLALLAYVRYVKTPSRRWYALLLAAFCAGLMSKPMIVTLPVLLLLIDIWPLRRRPSLREKTPVFALSAAAAIFTFVVQRGSGAVRTLEIVPLPLRIENAVLSYVVYIGKTFWPSGLAVFYPYPHTIPAWQAVLAGVAILAITFLVWRRMRDVPFLAVGWLWYLVTLLPVIGLVQVGSQARADRYMYVPMIGLLIMLAWGLEAAGGAGGRLWIAATGLTALACAALAWMQTGYWQDSETLFRHALSVTKENYVAEHNLGSSLLGTPAKLSEAEAHLWEAVRLAPDSVRAHTDLGSALAEMGRFPEAMAEYRTALQLDPSSEITRNNLANALADAARTHYSHGLDLAKAERLPEAASELQAAINLQPDNPEAQNNLGVVLSQMPERSAEAIAHFKAALKLRPEYEDARYNLAVALAETGKTAQAIQELETILRTHDDPQVRQALRRLRGHE